MKKDMNPLNLSPFAVGIFACLFSTITQADVRQLYRSGDYGGCLWLALCMAFINYVLFAVGFALLSTAYESIPGLADRPALRRPFIWIGTLVMFIVVFIASIYIMDRIG